MWTLTDVDALFAVGGLFTALCVYHWTEHVTRVKTLQAGHYALKDALKNDYWNKVDTQQHMDLVLRPIIQSLDAVAQSNKNLTDELRNLTNTLSSSAIQRGIHGL